MDDNNKKEFSRLLWLFANDAGVQISKEQLSIKFQSLSHFSIEEVSSAANHLLHYRKATWPALPSISEFTEVIESKSPKSIGIDDRSEIQAVEVLKKLKYDGRNGSIDFPDPITRSIMTDRWPYNSWAETVTESELVWWKKEFIVMYKAYAKHDSAGLLIEQADGKLIAVPGAKIVSANNLKQLATKSIGRI